MTKEGKWLNHTQDAYIPCLFSMHRSMTLGCHTIPSCSRLLIRRTVGPPLPSTCSSSKPARCYDSQTQWSNSNCSFSAQIIFLKAKRGKSPQRFLLPPIFHFPVWLRGTCSLQKNHGLVACWVPPSFEVLSTSVPSLDIKHFIPKTYLWNGNTSGSA